MMMTMMMTVMMMMTMMMMMDYPHRYYLENKEWWDQDQEKDWKKEARLQVMKAFSDAEKALKPSIKELFYDVYQELPKHLEEQYQECLAHVAKYPHEYPTDIHAKVE